MNKFLKNKYKLKTNDNKFSALGYNMADS